MKTLLEKAKEIPTKSFRRMLVPNDEQIELAIAWAKDEIQLKQVSKVLFGETSTSQGVGGKVLYNLAVFLREGIRKGILIEKKK